MLLPRCRSFIFLFVITFVVVPRCSNCWDFTAVDLPEDVFIWKFSVWRNRAFLAIPRWQRNETSKDTGTLFEALWPESSVLLVKASQFPSGSRNKPKGGECLRSVVKLDVDVRGRLWMLETPDNFDCAARVVLHNLKRKDQLVSSTELTNVPTRNLRALAVDQLGSKAYIGDAGDESIIALMPEKGKWWKIKMIHGPEVPRVFSTDLAISKKNSVLYMTGSDTLDLFSINLRELWDEEDAPMFKDNFPNVTAVWHGTKMGASVGLFCDVKDGLHYFMSSEKASVRWDTRLPLTAESHSILLQNENCPCITDYAMDVQKNLWGLINSKCSSTKNVKQSNFKHRTIKIGKLSTS
ncbi:uncharacterized protein LOC143185509 [Calliopsis andreniformis]|uniref:uncharacterized protein LOC143185509 n=1 Tax=Calliopsis andreniformis TaxID=337506 RepID=UPI003FCD9B75